MLKTVLQIPTPVAYGGNVECPANYILVMLYDTEKKRRVRYSDSNWSALDGQELHSPKGKDGFKSYREMMGFVKSMFKNLREFKVHQNCGIYDDIYGTAGYKLVWADAK